MCELTLSAYTRGCATPSGVAKAYLVDKTDRINQSITYTITSGAVAIAGTGGSAYTITPVQNSITFTQPPTADSNSNSYFWTQTLELKLDNITAASNVLNEELIKGRVEVLLEMVNGTYLLVGTDANGLQITGGDGGATGVARGDAKGSTLSFTCESQNVAPIAVFSEFSAAFTIT